MKFKSDIEVQAGLKDSSGAIGLSGQILSSTSGNVSWVTPTVNTVARDVQNEVKAGVAINKGQAVYVTGADGTNIIVGKASNTSEATSSKTLGLLNATVAVNGFADVVQIGRLAGLNTIGATVGDPVWLGVNGNLIYGLVNKPYAPAHLVFLGIVTRVNANNGEIFVNVQNGFELKEIHDVDIITNVPINGDILGYDGTLWVNKTIAEWLGYTPANASGTTNYVSKFTGATTLGNSQIFDNGTSVGINTSSPSERFQVNGNIAIDSLELNVPKKIKFNANRNTFGTYGDIEWYNFQWDGLIKASISAETSGALSNGTLVFKTSDGGSNASERMRILGNGNVGIGTTSPSAKTQIFTDRYNDSLTFNATAGFIIGGGIRQLSINTDDTSPYNISLQAKTNGNGAANIVLNSLGGNVGIGTTNPAARLEVNGTILGTDGSFGTLALGAISTRIEGNAATREMKFYTFNSEKMIINGLGNVGIGTTSPSAKLDVDANGYSIIANNGTGNRSLYLGTNGGEPSIQATLSNGSPRQLSLNPSGGNVGIGTTNPNYQTAGRLVVDINGSSQSLLGFSIATNPTAYIASTSTLTELASVSNPLLFTVGSERMRIASNGNVGIGTTNPTYKLDVNGTGRFSGQLNIPNNIDIAFGTITGNFIGQYYNGTDLLFYNGTGGASLFSIARTTGAATFSSSVQSSSLIVAGSGYFPAKIITLGGAEFSRYNANIGTNLINGSQIGLSFGTRSNNIDYDNTLNLLNGNVGIGTTSPGAKLDVSGLSIFNGTQVRSTENGTTIVGFFGNRSTWTGGSLDNNLSIGAYTGNICFFTNNSVGESMRITSGGNVGIGTTTDAGYKLDVNGTGRFSNLLQVNGSGATTRSDSDGISLFNSNVDYRIGFDSLSGARGYIRYNVDSALSTHGHIFSAGDWNATPTDLMLIRGDGNVGIGTTTPQSALSIGTNHGTLISIGQPLWANNIVLRTSWDGSDFTQLLVPSNGANTAAITLRNSGNVGIGTTSPAARLEVNGTILGTDGSFGTLALGAISTRIEGNAATREMKFYTFNSEKMIINGLGNVGIGTTSPSAKLHIKAPVNDQVLRFEQTNDVGSQYYFNIDSQVNGALSLVTNYLGSNVIGFSQNRSGNVGIGTTSPSGKLDVSGNIKAQGFYTPGFVIPAAAVGVFNNNNYGGPAWDNASFVTGNGATGVMMGGDPASYTYGWISGVQTDNGSIKKLVLQPLGGNVGIGTTTPDNSAALDVSSTTQGFLPPRLTTSERDAIGSPVNGLLIWNTDNRQLEVYAAGTWLGLATV